MLYRISQFIARCIFKLYFRLRIVGCENIPTEEPCIIVANHVSFLDPLLICAIVPRVIHYITYASFYYNSLLHWYCKRVYCIPIKKKGNDISALKQALRLLKKGEIVGIFPEGQRSVTGKLKEGLPGTSLIALRANVPILPVGIHGAYEAFPKGSKFPKPKLITLIFGEPFSLEDYLNVDEKSTPELQEKATNLIMSKIAIICGQEAELTQKTPQVVK